MMVNALLERYATDNVLEQAYDNVVHITQCVNEDEVAYPDRLRDASLRCPNVFTEQQLINLYLKGLQKPIQAAVNDASEGKQLPEISKIAFSHETSHRALRG